jgi:hypothetical protein
MNFDLRMQMVRQWLKDDLLPRFSAPNNVDKATAANDVAETVNANLPFVQSKDQFKFYLDAVCKHVIRNARGRTLPVPKDFVDACREAAKTKTSESAIRTEWRCNPYKITERRVKAGEAIGSTWLSERAIRDLIANTSLTICELQPYIDAHKQNERSDNG